MLKRKTNILLTLTVLVLAIQACSALPATRDPGLAPTPIIEPVFRPSQAALPESEAAVPRIPVADAKAAFDDGAAIIVDVRSAGAYQASHIPGAINIELEEFETNPAGLKLDKEQWIITYCTWPNEQTSARAAFILLHNGYTRVEAVLGGFEAWVDAGYPIE